MDSPYETLMSKIITDNAEDISTVIKELYYIYNNYCRYNIILLIKSMIMFNRVNMLILTVRDCSGAYIKTIDEICNGIKTGDFAYQITNCIKIIKTVNTVDQTSKTNHAIKLISASMEYYSECGGSDMIFKFIDECKLIPLSEPHISFLINYVKTCALGRGPIFKEKVNRLTLPAESISTSIQKLDNVQDQQIYISALFITANATKNNTLKEDIINNHINSLTMRTIKDYIMKTYVEPTNSQLLQFITSPTISTIDKKLINHYLIELLKD